METLKIFILVCHTIKKDNQKIFYFFPMASYRWHQRASRRFHQFWRAPVAPPPSPEGMQTFYLQHHLLIPRRGGGCVRGGALGGSDVFFCPFLSFFARPGIKRFQNSRHQRAKKDKKRQIIQTSFTEVFIFFRRLFILKAQ